MTNIHESPELNRYMGYWTTLTKEVKWGNSCDCKHRDQFYAAGYCAEERKPGVVCSILPSKCQTQMLLTFGFFRGFWRDHPIVSQYINMGYFGYSCQLATKNNCWNCKICIGSFIVIHTFYRCSGFIFKPLQTWRLCVQRWVPYLGHRVRYEAPH